MPHRHLLRLALQEERLVISDTKNSTSRCKQRAQDHNRAVAQDTKREAAVLQNGAVWGRGLAAYRQIRGHCCMGWSKIAQVGLVLR